MIWFHRHQWRTLSSQQSTQMWRATAFSEEFEKGPVTEVLQRCSVPTCQRLRTITLDGHWATEELVRDE